MLGTIQYLSIPCVSIPGTTLYVPYRQLISMLATRFKEAPPRRSPEPRRWAFRASARVIPNDNIVVAVVERQVQARRNRSNTIAKGNEGRNEPSSESGETGGVMRSGTAAGKRGAMRAKLQHTCSSMLQSYCCNSLHTYCSYCRCADRCNTPTGATAAVVHCSTLAAVCCRATAHLLQQSAHVLQLL
ncbi:hypothetical protein B296_00044599 [Ensete ventricosum]|uniref:Uncharacterized protein n=1 Tax=Ensete ventricosum TaxID=4639 RepID=A0A426ZAB7_ENSVE|nr:hypothetical protein B296_00044599 [Ensete ventricosum]